MLYDTVSGMMGGGSSAAAAPADNATPASAANANSFNGSGAASEVKGCEDDAAAFHNCMQSQGGQLSACQAYFDMLKQCRSDMLRYQ